MNAPSSIPSGNKFSQTMVDQRPRFDRKRIFRRKLRRGRPAKKDKRQFWIT